MKLLSPTRVAKRLGLSVAQVRTMDAELKPTRVHGGGRVYFEHQVERYAGSLDSKRETKPRKAAR